MSSMKKALLWGVLTGILLTIVTSSCSPLPQPQPQVTVTNGITTTSNVNVMPLELIAINSNNAVYKFTDPDTGITCYVMDGFESGGIDCIE